MLKITDPERIRDIVDLLTCTLCNKVFREATTINICAHTFCARCIYKRLQEDKTKSCPVCHEKLGSDLMEYLRPDESWRNLVKKITFGYKKKETEGEGEGEGEGSKAKSDVDNAHNAEEGNSGNSSPTSSLESTNNLPVAAFGTMVTKFKTTSDEASQTISEPMDIDDGELPQALPIRKKRNTTRKARQYNTATRESKGKQKGGNYITGSTDATRPEKMAAVTTKSKGKQKIEISSYGTDHGALPGNNMPPLWFLLLPAEDKIGNGFAKLDKPMLRLKDYSATVLIFQKYLKEKLNLEDEYEVEISCVGKKLDPTMNLHDIKKLWIQAVAPGGVKKMRDQWKLEELRIELTYSKRNV